MKRTILSIFVLIILISLCALFAGCEVELKSQPTQPGITSKSDKPSKASGRPSSDKPSKTEEPIIELKEIKILSASSTLIMWNAKVQNKSTSRTITSLSWKIEIFDSLRQIKVDELHVTQVDVGITETDKQIRILPGETPYISAMLGNIGGARWMWQSDYTLRISLENYKSS